MKIIEDHIVPVVRAFGRNQGIWDVQFHGTAFFIDDRGTFLTASHVIQRADEDFRKNGGFVGLIVRHPTEPQRRTVAPIAAFETAAEPNDVAIGNVDFVGQGLATKGAFVWPVDEQKVWMWQDVWAAGYPESAIARIGEAQRHPPRGYHGYVMRRIPRGQVLTSPHPDLFELNFPVVNGVSGSPLVLRGLETQSFILIGICRASHTSEITDYVEETVESDGGKLTEKRLKVEQYGLADDIRPLRTWKPRILNGRSLAEAVQTSYQ